MICREELRLLERLREHQNGVCIAGLSHREKFIADLLQESGLVRFDVALCITEAGLQALKGRPAVA